MHFLLNSETQSRQSAVGHSSTSGNCYCAQNVRDPQIRRRQKTENWHLENLVLEKHCFVLKFACSERFSRVASSPC